MAPIHPPTSIHRPRPRLGNQPELLLHRGDQLVGQRIAVRTHVGRVDTIAVVKVRRVVLKPRNHDSILVKRRIRLWRGPVALEVPTVGLGLKCVTVRRGWGYSALQCGGVGVTVRYSAAGLALPCVELVKAVCRAVAARCGAIVAIIGIVGMRVNHLSIKYIGSWVWIT